MSDGLRSYRAAINILGTDYPVLAEISKQLMRIERYRAAEALLEHASEDKPEFPLALGLLAKQMLVTLPFLLLVLDFFPLGRWKTGERRRVVLEKLPLVALALIAGAATLLAQSAGAAIRSFELLPLGVRLSNAVAAYASYLGDSVRPTNLAVFYPHPWLVDREGFNDLQVGVLVSGALLVIVSFGYSGHLSDFTFLYLRIIEHVRKGNFPGDVCLDYCLSGFCF